jgi:tetratricopeptide (TPR) repeat protein
MFTPLFALLAVVALASPLAAQNEGQADLDKATELQLTAESLSDMEKVIALAEGALKKGLDKGQAEFARQLLAATLFQHANRSAEAIFGQSPPSRRWPLVRDRALKDLDKAKSYDPKLPDVYLLQAKLQLLPGGDQKAAQNGIDEAVKLLQGTDNVKDLAKALVLRAAMSKDKDKQLADFDAAIKADPDNTDAWQGRALVYLERGESEKAIADLEKLVEKEVNNPAAIGALAEALTNLKKYDEAIKYSSKVIELAPRITLGYSLRARAHILKNDLKSALADLTEALKVDPNDLPSLLMRSRLNAAEGNDDEARADVEKALRISPDLPQAILMRSMLAAQQEKYGEAIADIQSLLQTDPTNVEYRLQLATYMVGDKRPRKAIDVLTSIIEEMGEELNEEQKETKSDALRARGDALLSVGKHADAIKDYEEALKLTPDDTGVLNNLAWVLATSPEDGLRNAERSIELGTKACELTKYERPHILSTLASGYAEKGDWENAIKWSSKAVELGAKEKDVSEQLQKELDSYKEKKPWREKQEVEENTKPLGAKPKDLET